MNKDQFKGKIDNAKGRIKEAAGAVSGDKKMEAEGVVERVKGAGQEKLGDVKQEVAKSDIERRREAVDESEDE